jgi:hypothetical protein
MHAMQRRVHIRRVPHTKAQLEKKTPPIYRTRVSVFFSAFAQLQLAN